MRVAGPRTAAGAGPLGLAWCLPGSCLRSSARQPLPGFAVGALAQPSRRVRQDEEVAALGRSSPRTAPARAFGRRRWPACPEALPPASGRAAFPRGRARAAAQPGVPSPPGAAGDEGALAPAAALLLFRQRMTVGAGEGLGLGCGRWIGGCLLLLGGVLAGLPSRNPEGFPGPAENQTSGAPGSARLILELPGDVFEYVATPLDWWRADGYCKGRFARLPPAAWERELAALGRRLQPHPLGGAIWLEDNEALLQRPLQRRARSVPILVFRNKTDTKFVKVLADFPGMSAVSACAHVQWDPRAVEVSTVFSYAVPAFINEFQLRGFVDEEGLVRLAVILHGHHSPYLPAFRSDGQWHHLCVTWQQRGGSWALYADGREKAAATGLLASQGIAGHGTFIIGQDQDSLGGAFTEKEAFSGNLTGLQVWQRALSRGQVARVRGCASVEEGLVFGWSRDVLQVEGSVQQATVQLTCPGNALDPFPGGSFAMACARPRCCGRGPPDGRGLVQMSHGGFVGCWLLLPGSDPLLSSGVCSAPPGPTEECRVLALAPGALSHASCRQALPFACHYRKDVYFQLKEMWPQSIPPFAARVNAQAHAAVRRSPPPLDAAALLGVVHLLRRASEVDVQEPGEPLVALEQLGRNYMEVAGRVLEAESADKWAEIQPIVGGPMAIVEGVDKMAASLQQLLSPERPQVTLQSKNVGVQVRQVELGKMAASSAVYVPPSWQQDRLDQIEVPAEEVERLRARGLRRITLTNTWFGCGSLQRLLAGGRTAVAGAAVAVSDGGRRWVAGPVLSKHLQPFSPDCWQAAGRVSLCSPPAGPPQPPQALGSLSLSLSLSVCVCVCVCACACLSVRLSVCPSLPRHLRTQVGSAIISSTLMGDFEEISTAVRFRLQHHWLQQGLPDQRVEPVCAFWDFRRSPEAGGEWSATGCSVVASHADFTSCSCNHTTNFAVLLQVFEVQRSAEEEATLKTLTFVGCGVSFCALSVTFVLFLAVGVPKSERTTVHKNLIFALAAAEALLMFSELARTSQGACLAVTALLHLFFMAAFAWMLVEGLLLWSKVVAVNMSEGRRMRFYYATGWGLWLPVVIVGVTLATSFDRYVAEGHCWLNVETDVIWAFVGPVLLVLVVNSVVLVRVVAVTVSSARRRSRMLTPNSSLEKQVGPQLWATTKPVLVLLPVLGLTWGCGVLVHLSIAWAYVFIVLNSLQGLYIFLVYAVYNTEVRSAIQRMKERKAALSFTNCSHPANYLSSPRNTSWEKGRSSLEHTAPRALEKGPAVKGRGHFSARSPAGLTSVMSPESTAVQLTAFKSAVNRTRGFVLWLAAAPLKATEFGEGSWCESHSGRSTRSVARPGLRALSRKALQPPPLHYCGDSPGCPGLAPTKLCRRAQKAEGAPASRENFLV
ncbi:hypothetical protein lerEdw1_010573 [Lerista edwardsae]|nr:hypothetical protein lerEdw1_010573 [Lerista edwardsae]